MKMIIKEVARRIANQFREPFNTRLVFVHIPKCGGVSIDRAIKSCYRTMDIRNDLGIKGIDPVASLNAVAIVESGLPANHSTLGAFDPMALREQVLLYYMAQKKTKYISGHFAFSNLAYENFNKDFGFITILRDPVQRFISEFVYNKFKKIDHCKIRGDLEEYLDSPFAKASGRSYVRYLCGKPGPDESMGSAAVSYALDNLRKFDVVGKLEDMARFSDSFEKRFNRHLKIKKENITPNLSALEQIKNARSIRKRIEDLCEMDTEICREWFKG